MTRKISKTRLIQDNRITRMNLDVLIDSMKKGLFDSEFSGNVFDEKSIYSKVCKIKSCEGKLNYDQFGKYFYCDLCAKKQKLEFIKEEKIIRKLEKIDNSIVSFRNYKIKELELISQLLRNLYRIITDNLEPTNPTDNQIQESNQLSKKVHSILFGIRTALSVNSGRYDLLYTVIKDGKIMSFDEIEHQVKETRYRQMLMIDRISEQFSKQNILKLTILNIPDEPRKKINLQKSENKIKVLLA